MVKNCQTQFFLHLRKEQPGIKDQPALKDQPDFKGLSVVAAIEDLREIRAHRDRLDRLACAAPQEPVIKAFKELTARPALLVLKEMRV
jgi:hypothetical protein